MTAEQRAREVLAEHGVVEGFGEPPAPGSAVIVSPYAIITAMLAFAADTREECARVAEGRAGYRKRGETIAQAIRRGESEARAAPLPTVRGERKLNPRKKT